MNPLRQYHGLKAKTSLHAIVAEDRVRPERYVAMSNVEDAVEVFVVECVEEDEVEL